MRKYLGPVATVAAILLFGGLVTANAASQITGANIKDGSIQTADYAHASVSGWKIKNNDVTTVDIKDGTLQVQDFSTKALASLKGKDGKPGATGKPGADGTNGVDGKDGVVAPVYETGTVNVANIGGRFADRATTALTVNLPAGEYLVTTDALFRSNQATSGNTTLQVAVRAQDGTEWGQDLGTGFTGESPEAADREVSTSTTRVVTLEEDTEVKVLVFGYENNGSGSADSGKFDAEVYFTAVPVQR